MRPYTPEEKAKADKRIADAAEYVRLEYTRIVDGLNAKLKELGIGMHGGHIVAIMTLGETLISSGIHWAQGTGLSYGRGDFRDSIDAVLAQVKKDCEAIAAAERTGVN